MKINTLHICNLDEVKSFDFYQSLISTNDCIIFYAYTISKAHHAKLENLTLKVNKFYMSSVDEKHLTNLTMEKWVHLVNLSNKTLTWK